MPQSLAMVSLVVREYDDAIRYFTQILGFDLVEDTRLSAEKRWVVVSPPGNRGARLLLARASNKDQEDHVGNQTGGRVFLFLWTDDFWRDYHSYQAKGVTFVDGPRREEYGMVAVFVDQYGNKWDLVEKANGI